jgi:hypothetical protein
MPVIAPGVTDSTGDERRALRMLLDRTHPHERPDTRAELARAKRV